MTTPLRVPAGGHQLRGDYGRPSDGTPPRGLVLFAHGSGSSRHSPRNHYVARTLEQHGLATLLIDLLTPEEDQIDQLTAQLRFDIPLLASRLGAIVEWLRHQRETAPLPIGLFGASTGGGAALMAAAAHPDQVAAVVSRGGRPDLAGDALPHVTAPTLLIVGGHDEPVVEMNREAMLRMRNTVDLEIVTGATHLFEEPGALERVARLAASWFLRYLRPTMETVASAPTLGT